MGKPIFQFKSLKALSGNSFLIRYGCRPPYTNILIDAGTTPTFLEIEKELHYLLSINEKLDLVILTHIDDDHICGILPLLNRDILTPENTGKILFNSKFREKLEQSIPNPKYNRNDLNRSYKNALNVEKAIISSGIEWERQEIMQGHSFELQKGKITILSPNRAIMDKFYAKEEIKRISLLRALPKSDYQLPVAKLIQNSFIEDSSLTNQASITLIFEFHDKRILFLADSVPSQIIEGFSVMGQKSTVQFTLVQVAHHGSKKNTNQELLELLDCSNFLISTNGSCYNHPDKECLARIMNYVDREKKIFFNYEEIKNAAIFSSEEIIKYKISQEVIESNGLDILSL